MRSAASASIAPTRPRRSARRLASVALLAALAPLALSVLALTSRTELTAGAGKAKPNVLVVITDDQDVASLRVMRKLRRTLGDGGLSFVNAFANTPLCCPARAIYLSGQYAHNNGVISNRGSRGGYSAFDPSANLAEAVNAAGYRTGFIGKYMNGYWKAAQRSPAKAVPPGFDHWVASLDHTMYGYRLNVNGRLKRLGRKARHYDTNLIARRAHRFIDQSLDRGTPFFLSVLTLAPHGEPKRVKRNLWPSPRPAPRHRARFGKLRLPRPPSFNLRNVSGKPRVVRRESRFSHARKRELRQRHRSRLRSLLAVDDMVDRLIRRLRERGALDDTYVIFTSDNGFMLGEHRLVGKLHLYEESVRVPLLIRGPGIPAGATREQLVGLVDLAPTIYALTGSTPLREPDGISLLPLIADPRAEIDRSILLENHVGASAVRAPGLFYAEHSRSDETELYDLEADPHQLDNVRDEPRYRADRDRLAARLEELRDCAGSECR